MGKGRKARRSNLSVVQVAENIGRVSLTNEIAVY